MPQVEAQKETYWESDPVGESSRGCCKVNNGNACGSGSLVGVRNGRSLVMTNAHVAGTRVGRSMRCTFPFADNAQVMARLIMAGYSDRVLMDWAVLELDRLVDLPHVPMRSNKLPDGPAYTAGYPRCRGPYYSKVSTTSISHNGTLWRWHPNAIGGQSGSGVHLIADDLQYGLLTWSWGGDGAGQTTRSIYQQYVRRSVFGLPRPEGLKEVNEDRLPAGQLEEGYFAQTNITTLPIWTDGSEPRPDPEPDPTPSPELAKKVLSFVDEWDAELDKLREVANQHLTGEEDQADEEGGNSGGTFGL